MRGNCLQAEGRPLISPGATGEVVPLVPSSRRPGACECLQETMHTLQELKLRSYFSLNQRNASTTSEVNDLSEKDASVNGKPHNL